jgi:hypothetical protein
MKPVPFLVSIGDNLVSSLLCLEKFINICCLTHDLLIISNYYQHRYCNIIKISKMQRVMRRQIAEINIKSFMNSHFGKDAQDRS